ncbi:MAG: NYN domain-containing protein [Lachnospiraceae bacterium]
MDKEKKYALLIDADNVSPKYIDLILRETKAFGNVSIRRIYGDWTEIGKNTWKECLLENSVTPIQQYSYTTGKNASDSAMIIDAMDILYTRDIDGFVLVSSDSDFTKLAMRLRESGKYVIGMGESKTPSPFVKACDQFKQLDILMRSVMNEMSEKGKSKAAKQTKKKELETDIVPITNLREIKATIFSLLNEHSDESGWMFLGELGNMVLKLYPDFDCRNYGFAKLSNLIDSFKDIEVRRETAKDSHNQLVYVKKRD